MADTKAAPNGNLVSTDLQTSLRQTINMQTIAALASRAGSMVEQIRSMLLAPEARKIPPTFSTAQLAALCRVDKAHVAYRITKTTCPPVDSLRPVASVPSN